MNSTLRNLTVYNPAAQSGEALKRGFIVRRDVLDALLEVLRKETKKSIAKHQVLIGQRGMGKTTLLYRLALAIREDDELKQRWLPLNFQEEQFNVTDLSVFWRNCFDALIDAAEAEGLPVADFDAEQKRLAHKDADTTLRAFMQAATTLKRRPLLLVDNLDMVFARISDAQAWALRATLQEPSAPMIIGAATQPLEQHYDHNQAFYDFLQVRWLDQLDFTEAQNLLKQLANDHGLTELVTELDRNPARLIPLHLFSGGNLRTLILLFKVLAEGVGDDVQKDVEDLLDACTPLYKARIEALAPQQQAVFVAVALAFDPISAADLDQKLQLGINTVSAQLNKLVQAGLLCKAPTGVSKRLHFEVAERFFGIWYLMRANRRDRSRLQWLARFLRDWYASDSKALTMSAESLLIQVKSSSGVHTVMMLADGVPDAQEVRRAALARLSESDRSIYMWADIPKLTLPSDSRARTKLARAFSKRTLHIFDWALPILSEAKADLASLTTLRSAHAAVQNLLQDPERCLAILLRQPESSDRSTGISQVLRAMPERALGVEDVARNARADDNYASAVQTNKMFAGIHHIVGVLLNPNKRDEAEAEYRAAILLDETNADTWNNLGTLLNFSKEAEAAFRTAIQLNHTHAQAWVNLGTLLHTRCSYEDAEAAYLNAINSDENQSQAWNNLTVLWKEKPSLMSRHRGATLDTLFDRAARLERLPAIFDHLIYTLLDSGKLSETLTALEQTGLVSRAQPMVEALRALHLQAPAHLATLSAELREASYHVLKRVAPAFAERIAREMPAMVAGFVLPDRV